MNRSLRSRRSIASKSVPDVWKRGEDVFGQSPSPVKRKNLRRETKMGLKKFSKKLSPKMDRRSSILLKRLESDLKVTVESDVNSKRRTRRQSMANISKSESKTVRTTIPRAKSEKSVPKKKTSPIIFRSPSVKLEKLKTENFSTTSINKEISHKSSSSLSVSKECFYSKSPVIMRQTRRQSMAKLSEFKKSAVKVGSPKTSRTEVKNKSHSKSKSNISSEKSYKQKQKALEKDETFQENIQKVNSAQRDKVPEAKTRKTKTPLRKPVKKRLSALTPSPLPLKTKRLTRSSVRKRVKISADSPPVSAEFRKTPRSFGNQIKITDSPVSASILKPYTPKPEEPLKILKQTLKRNVATEMRNSMQCEVSDFMQSSIVRSRKPLKSTASSPAVSYFEKSKRSPKKSLEESPVKNGINHHHHQEESYSSSFQIPSTPVSSRKSVSFRRFRGSVRLMEEESQKKSDASELNISQKNPLSSTPVRLGTNNKDYHETSMDFSEVSTTHEESNYSLSASFTTNDNSYSGHHFEGSKADVSNENLNKFQNVEQQSSKKSYCSLM